jgi:hypothetical protein
MVYSKGMIRCVEYEVKPGKNVPAGLPPLLVAVLSPIWRGSALTLKYPDGLICTVVGWSGSGAGSPCDLRVFWTRQQPSGPAVCLALGGDAGLKDLGPVDGSEPPRGLPFLALAESLIPAEVLEVIGPPPPPSPLLLL